MRAAANALCVSAVPETWATRGDVIVLCRADSVRPVVDNMAAELRHGRSVMRSFKPSDGRTEWCGWTLLLTRSGDGMFAWPCHSHWRRPKVRHNFSDAHSIVMNINATV